MRRAHLFLYFFIYLFIYCYCLFIFRWFVVVTVVVVVVVVVFVLLSGFCCFAVLSKHFIINLQLIWAEIIPVSCSNPDTVVAIWLSVLVTITKPRISIVSCIVCNVDVMAPKSWKIAIVAVRGVLIVVVYVLFEISITVIVFQ